MEQTTSHEDADKVTIVRRLGAAALPCGAGQDCPNIFELSSGSYLVVGANRTAELRAQLPSDAGCADTEQIVEIPAAVLRAAIQDLA